MSLPPPKHRPGYRDVFQLSRDAPHPAPRMGSEARIDFKGVKPVQRRSQYRLVDGRAPPPFPSRPSDPYHPSGREGDVTEGPDDVPLYGPRPPRLAYGGGDPRSYTSPFLNRARIRYYEDATYGSIYDPNPDPHGDPTVGFPQAYDRV